jgi:phosphate:Na+ symporter
MDSKPHIVAMIENLLIMIGGLALFMYAITLLRETLGKISGKRVAKILEKTTDSPVKGMGVGTAATLMTQSSSITVLTLIGLGSEIGTTITAQLVSFKIGIDFAWLLIAIGFFTTMFLKNENAKMAGRVIFSLGLLFLSMDFMKSGAAELGESQVFVDLIIAFGVIPIFGILIGATIAGITQSSSATTSLVIAMSMAGVIGLPAAIALIMGANIGTCFLENMAAIGATTPAKRTAIAQTIINIVGVAVFFPFFGQFADVVALTSNDLPRQIANAHTIFNVTVSFMLIPFVGLIVKLCEKLIPDKEGEIIRYEDKVDDSCRATEKFIDKIREEELNKADTIWRMKLLAILVDIERVGDLTSNIAEFAIDRLTEEITFSPVAVSDMEDMFRRFA